MDNETADAPRSPRSHSARERLMQPPERPAAAAVAMAGWAMALGGFFALAAVFVLTLATSGELEAADVAPGAPTLVIAPVAVVETIPAPPRFDPRARLAQLRGRRVAAAREAASSAPVWDALEAGAAIEEPPGAPIFPTAAPAAEPAPFRLAMLEAPDAPSVAPTPAPPSAPLVAIVIDDVGLDRAAAARAVALPAPVTLSFLSYAEGGRALQDAALASGHEVFVHLPMEPRGLADPGPGALTTWLGPDEIAARAAAAFDAAPAATGFNNHMGSRFTACEACIAPVLAAARARGLIALDSVTDARTALAHRAAETGVRAISRDVFLDNERTREAVLAQLARVEAVARARGWAIAIGHPHDVTLEALEDWLAEAPARGVAPASVSDVLDRSVGRARLRG